MEMVRGNFFQFTVLVVISLFLLAWAKSDEEDSLEATNVILFLFFGLCCGIVITQITSYWGEPIPYTVIIFLVGLMCSLADTNQGTFGKSVRDWVNINADLMLFIFLPPLVFGEAMNLNWYYAKGGLVQSLILAGPGVLIGAALMGVVAKLALPYHWPWNFSMMFGSILAATDTVAMVALLKSVGASPKLTILIVGESLLNDGSAMILFTIFFNSVNGELYTAESVVGFVFATVLGSIALGALMGAITVRWLRSANRPLVETDVTMQIAITICSAYIIFFIAQNTFQISGLLACASGGAVLAWLAPPIILNHESMHNIWGILEWGLNTVIFLLAGLISGHRILSKVHSIDWLYVLVLYIALMIIRFITVGILFPGLSYIGHKCSIKEAVFVSWSGLRGALGMALALLVENDCPDDIKDQTSRLFFYVGGIAALTLIINATTAKWVLLKLNLVSGESTEKELITKQIKKKLQKKTDKLIAEMAVDFDLSQGDIEEVRMSCTLLQDMDIQGLMRETEVQSSLVTDRNIQTSNHYMSVDQAAEHSLSSNHLSTALNHSSLKLRFLSRSLSMQHRGNSGVMIEELVHYVRAIFLEIVKVKYWHFIEEGRLPRLSFSAQYLLYTIDVALDEVYISGGGRDWKCLKDEIDNIPPSIQLLRFYQSIMPASLMAWSSYTLGWLEARKEKREVYMLSAFIEAHEHAQKKIHSFLGLDSHMGMSADEDGESGSHVNDLPCPEEVSVIEESKRVVQAAKTQLSLVNSETIAAIRSKQAARVILSKQAQLVKNMKYEGLLTSQHAEEFLQEISNGTQRIESERNKMYRQHRKKRAKEMQTEKEVRESEFGRSSFLSFLSDSTFMRKSSEWRKSYNDNKEDSLLGADPVTDRLVNFVQPRTERSEEDDDENKSLGEPFLPKK